MSEYKPVPVEAAAYVSQHCGKDVVVIGSIDHAHNRLHVTTYGRTAHDKVLAAEAGEVIGNALSDMSRVERFEDFRLEPAKVKEQRDELLAALMRLVAKHRDDVFICGADDEAPVAFALNEAENAIAKATQS